MKSTSRSNSLLDEIGKHYGKIPITT